MPLKLHLSGVWVVGRLGCEEGLALNLALQSGCLQVTLHLSLQNPFLFSLPVVVLSPHPSDFSHLLLCSFFFLF